MIIPKTTTNKQLLYGDFDKDGTPNVDDQRPFDKSNPEQVNKEVRLYDDLVAVQNKRRVATEYIRSQGFAPSTTYNGNTIFSRQGYTARVKDDRSIIHKALVKSQYNTNDIVGIRKETEKREQAQKEWEEYNRKINAKKNEIDNKYESNKETRNPYRAFHTNTTVLFKGQPLGVEAQFRTKKYGALNDAMHTTYKKNNINVNSFLKKGKQLIKKGY